MPYGLSCPAPAPESRGSGRRIPLRARGDPRIQSNPIRGAPARARPNRAPRPPSRFSSRLLRAPAVVSWRRVGVGLRRKRRRGGEEEVEDWGTPPRAEASGEREREREGNGGGNRAEDTLGGGYIARGLGVGPTHAASCCAGLVWSVPVCLRDFGFGCPTQKPMACFFPGVGIRTDGFIFVFSSFFLQGRRKNCQFETGRQKSRGGRTAKRHGHAQ